MASLGNSRPINHEAQLVALNGSPKYLGTIVATTAKDNSNTATPFTIDAGAFLLLQSDSAVYVMGQSTAATAVTVNNGFLLAANEKFTIILARNPDEQWVSCLPVSGTANVKVFQLK